MTYQYVNLRKMLWCWCWQNLDRRLVPGLTSRYVASRKQVTARNEDILENVMCKQHVNFIVWTWFFVVWTLFEHKFFYKNDYLHLVQFSSTYETL